MDSRNQRECPACGKADLVHETRSQPYSWQSQWTILEGIEGDFCPACHEGVLGPDAINRVGRLAQAFQQQVKRDAGTDDKEIMTTVVDR